MGIGNPYDIRNRAMNDLIKVYSSTFASGIKRFTMSRLVMNKLGEFYLCIPRPLELRTENQGLLIVNEEQRRTRKLAKWLCSNHRIVLIPEFQTQNMIRRSLCSIQSKPSRAMCTWSHYRFINIYFAK
ncbi:unnamed protein product [Rhizophagus irregularis]|uniref:Uncharacterized protein n=1 Tax=Rhizophagus irregularis TaxID=588596 RepID=A0A915ZXM7_9GLOM|nr:unnamed protein product [Rhizophagus irregularis]CAB5362310.1 unnamed protein product [Rhizophagus irregularis]CAB5394659.1 unnamed protein product [Rhizophagus irregularis]